MQASIYTQTVAALSSSSESNGCIGREDVGEISSVSQIEVLPWKITYLNIRRIVTNNTKDKLLFLKDYTKQEQVLIMNFTETWLNETIQDDLNIEGYNLHRGDRKGRTGGGTAVYVREEYETRKIAEISINGVEMLAVYFKKLNIINIVIYRPPNARLVDFSEVLEKVNVILKEAKAPEPTVIITGDFNFPFIKWNRMENGGCVWKEKEEVGAIKEAKTQFEILNNAFDEFGLIQIVEEATRDKNTLDLIYTNELTMITHIDVMKTNMSDHNRIELTTNIKSGNNLAKSNEDEIKYNKSCLCKLDFNIENIEWEEIKKELGAIPWLEIFEDKDTESCF